MGSALRALSAVSAAVGLFITTGGVAMADAVTVVGLRPARQAGRPQHRGHQRVHGQRLRPVPVCRVVPSASGGTKPRVVLLSYENNVDSSEHAERVRTLRSVDGGASFTELADSVPIKSMTQLADGSLVTVNYRTARPSEPAPGPVETPTPTATATDASPTPSATDASPSPDASEPATSTSPTSVETPSGTTTDAPADPTTDPVTLGAPALAAAADTPSPSTSTPPVAPTGSGTTTFVTTYWRSTDDGATWTQSEGSLVSPFRLDKVWFHRGIVHAADGSLLAPVYGYAENDTRYRSMLARSLDGGATWRDHQHDRGNPGRLDDP